MAYECHQISLGKLRLEGLAPPPNYQRGEPVCVELRPGLAFSELSTKPSSIPLAGRDPRGVNRLSGTATEKWSPLLFHSWLGRSRQIVVQTVSFLRILLPDYQLQTFWHVDKCCLGCCCVVGSKIGVTASPRELNLPHSFRRLGLSTPFPTLVTHKRTSTLLKHPKPPRPNRDDKNHESSCLQGTSQNCCRGPANPWDCGPHRCDYQSLIHGTLRKVPTQTAFFFSFFSLWNQAITDLGNALRQRIARVSRTSAIQRYWFYHGMLAAKNS